MRGVKRVRQQNPDSFVQKYFADLEIRKQDFFHTFCVLGLIQRLFSQYRVYLSLSLQEAHLILLDYHLFLVLDLLCRLLVLVVIV